jgi:hypothetical protein
MSAFFRVAIASVLLLAGCATQPAGDPVQFANPRPMLRASDGYQTLLLQRAYGDLERAAGEAHSSSSLISDGQPRLAAIYAGTAGCICGYGLPEEIWKLRGQRLREWHDKYPQSVTAKVALAYFPLQYGWFLRGGGYADTVSPEAWKRFAIQAEAARNALESLDADAKKDPGWYGAMLDVAIAQGWPKDRFQALYERAAREHPYYFPIYFAGASYYSPKWYGSIQELQSFIERAADATRPKLAETLYAPDLVGNRRVRRGSGGLEANPGGLRADRQGFS